MKVKRLHPDAVIPKYANEGDSGFDLYTTEDETIKAKETKLIKTGLAFEIPKGYEIQVRPRSGITLKTKLRVHLGTIDENYRGDVGIIAENVSSIEFSQQAIPKGTRLAQAVLVPVARTTFEEVEELEETERGSNGFGSTGLN